MFDKKNGLSVLRIFLLTVTVLAFFLTWQMRKEIIVGPVPAVIHMALFWGLFVLIRKKVRAGSEEIKDGATKGEKTVLKIILLFIGISLLLFILAPLFF